MKKFLTKQLYIKCFYGNEFDKSEDKFLIGFLNKEGSKLKDAITGQIVEDIYFISIKNSRFLKTRIFSLMTDGCSEIQTNFQYVKAEIISSILLEDIVNEKQLAKIKKSMNKEIVKSHKKIEKYLEAKREEAEEKKKDLEQYSIDESERDF